MAHVPVIVLHDSTSDLVAHDAIVRIADVQTTKDSVVRHADMQMFPEEETKRAETDDLERLQAGSRAACERHRAAGVRQPSA
jgi:hypothetical protein